MKETEKIFASNLKRLRCNAGLTQKQLANMIDYSEKSLSKWESGIAVPPGAVLPLLAKSLNCSIDDLFATVKVVEYYLGIDGGGTKTEFALADKSGNILERFSLGAGNPVDIGIDACFNVLKSGIERISQKVELAKVSVFAGMAGGITGNNQALIRSFLEKFGFAAVDNNSDALNAVAAGLGTDDGISVIIGTGSVAFTKVGDETFRTGGFGYLLEAGGSGFSIGRDAVYAALKYEEGNGKETVLYEKILKKSGVNNLLSNLSEFYNGGKKEFASYAQLVFEAFEEGDAIATEILHNNMRSVAELVTSAAQKGSFKNKIKVVFCGGVSKSSHIIFPIIKKYIKSNKYSFEVCDNAPVLGALQLAGMTNVEVIKNV